MRLLLAIAAVLCVAAPAFPQATSPTTASKSAQHQPGTTAPSAAASHAPGQTAAPPSESAEKIDPAKEAAIRHLMDITQTAKLGDNIATYLTGQVRDGVKNAIAPENLSKFMDTFNQKFAATAPGPTVTDAMVPIYAKAFSMEDIQSLTQFYESPLGQRMVKALPDVVQQSQAAGIQIEQASALNILRSMADDYPELKQMLPPEDGQSAAGTEAAPGAVRPAAGAK
ncbi:MAG TPA: DUF2059 domain-containing protein [Candidatus Acidoferrales bacterium]|nr:DUF2059 domain-containing protein [Candidatus Acidoferrales bacterium]